MGATAVAVGRRTEEAIGQGFQVVPGEHGTRLVWRASLALLGFQLAGMLAFSTVQYQRFNLTTDFAAYSQAWAAIAHGHLNPYSSVFGLPFWRNDLELLTWPLALVYWVYPHGVTLLWLQDLAVVGGEWVVLAWARELLTKPAPNRRASGPWLLAMVACLVVLTPWSWFTIGFDFHWEAFATLFALLAGRALWAHRYRWLPLWAALTVLSCAAPGSLYLVGLGMAALLTRHSRRPALAVVVMGGSWLLLASAIGAMRFGGLSLNAMYGYLSPHAGSGLGGDLEGLARAPVRALDMAVSHAGYLAGYVASAGVIGLRSLWGLLPAVFILLPSALNANPNFIHSAAAFQSWAAVLFLVVGGAFVLQRFVVGSSANGKVVGFLGCCSLASALLVTASFADDIPAYIERVSAGAAARLAAVERSVPAGAQVIVSQGVIGRFGPNRAAYPYWAEGAPERYPVTRSHRPVVFVLAPVQGTAEGYPAETRRAIDYVRGTLHARSFVQGDGIWAFVWLAPRSVASVVLP